MRFIICATILVIFSLSQSAFADKLPDEIMDPYRSYRASLEDGKTQQASKFAKKAWQAAEEHLGDHKTTGDLAYNFVTINSGELSKDQHKAYQRSIELAAFSSTPGVDSLTRQVSYMERQVSQREYDASMLRRTIKNAEKVIDTYNMKGTTFHGEITIFRGIYENSKGWEDKALASIDEGIKIIKESNDDFVSVYPLFGRIYKGDILRTENERIPAALEYQAVMQNLEGHLPADHPVVKRAFVDWMELRYELDEDGLLAEAEKAGLCECWPFEAYKDELVPLKRVPPKMPYSANRSGHVYFIFDVNDDGKPVNIRVLNATDDIFILNATNSVEKWQYSKNTGEEDPKTRKDITTKVSFILYDEFGRIIPERKN